MSTYDPTATYLNRSFRNIPHQVRLQRIERKLQSICKDRRIRSYLDVGCASGFVTSRIKEVLSISEVEGTDSSEEYIARAKSQYPDIGFRKMDLNATPTAERVFDLVTCFETLEHVGSLDNALQNIYLRIKSGGLGLISVPIESGPVGVVKFVLKSTFYGDKMTEISPDDRKRYLPALIRGRDISVFRHPARAVWWDHFGFNFNKIEDLLAERNISFVSKSYFTTRFITVFKY